MEIVYTGAFEGWFRRVRARQARVAIGTRIRRLERGNFGDHRSVGKGVSELRINVGPGYRVYDTIQKQTVVILLCGGDKSSQQEDIHRAQQMVREP